MTSWVSHGSFLSLGEGLVSVSGRAECFVVFELFCVLRLWLCFRVLGGVVFFGGRVFLFFGRNIILFAHLFR